MNCFRSDLGGDVESLRSLLNGIPLSVFAHNVECVPRLDRLVRDPRASFAAKLGSAACAKVLRPDMLTKSSIMIGLGETDDEVTDAMRQLRGADVDMLTLGQYLAPGRPGERFLPVDRFVPPEQFDAWADEAKRLGFRAVAAGPARPQFVPCRTFVERSTSGVFSSILNELLRSGQQPALIGNLGQVGSWTTTPQNLLARRILHRGRGNSAQRSAADDAARAGVRPPAGRCRPASLRFVINPAICRDQIRSRRTMNFAIMPRG